MSKPIQLSAKTLKNIAESLFLAYTAEQAAYMAGVSPRTLARLREEPLWQTILSQSNEMEKPYRKKIYSGQPGWQGAAWMLERKYASQFARPDIQLSLNTSNNTTNQTIVITAEQAGQLKARNASLDAELDKLVPPGAKPEVSRLLEPSREVVASVVTPDVQLETNVDSGQLTTEGKGLAKNLPSQDPVASQKTSTTKSIGVVEETPPAPGGGTPDAPSGGVKPNLTPKSKSVVSSSNYKRGPLPNSKSVDNSSNYRRKKVSQGTKARAKLGVGVKKV